MPGRLLRRLEQFECVLDRSGANAVQRRDVGVYKRTEVFLFLEHIELLLKDEGLVHSRHGEIVLNRLERVVQLAHEHGNESRRERGCREGMISGVVVSSKKKKT